MALGGKRQGSGRKKGSSTLEALAYRELLLKRVEEEKLGLIDALIKKGKTGDVQALREINERILGKVPQALTGEGGGAIQVAWLNSLQSNTLPATGPKPSTQASHVG